MNKPVGAPQGVFGIPSSFMANCKVITTLLYKVIDKRYWISPESDPLIELTLFVRNFSRCPMRDSRLSVTLHSSLTAPRFSMKIRSLLTTKKSSIRRPLGKTTTPAELTASGNTFWTCKLKHSIIIHHPKIPTKFKRFCT